MSASQIATSVTIIDNLKGFNALSLSGLDTSSVPSILAGSVVEVAGAFFSFALDDTPTVSTLINDITAWLYGTPSGTVGSQILTLGWSNTQPTWVGSKNGFYLSSGSSIRAIASFWYEGGYCYDKQIMTNENTTGNTNTFRGGQYGVYGKCLYTGDGVHGESSLGKGVSGTATGGGGSAIYGVTLSDGAGPYSSAVQGLTTATSNTAILGTAIGASGKAIEGVGPASGYDFYASGAGTNYGPFTGGHEVKIEDDCIQGMLLSCTGEVHNRDNSISSTLPCVKKSCVVNDKAIFGVFNSITSLPKGHWYTPQPGEQFATCNALGEGRVLVTDINGELKLGDYITTSTVEGYGQRQDDDLLHSYTLGKVTETVDWSSVKKGKSGYKEYLIACVYVSA